MNKAKTRKLIISPIEIILVLGYILFEELVWDVFVKPVHQYLKSLSILAPLKIHFLKMNRHLLLSVFICILAITETLGILAGYCIINGYFYTGILIYSSKIPVATFTFWLFKLTKNKLISFPWLKSTYEFIMGLIEKITHSSIHRFIKIKVSNLRNTARQFYLIYINRDDLIAMIKKRYMNYKHSLINTMKKNT